MTASTCHSSTQSENGYKVSDLDLSYFCLNLLVTWQTQWHCSWRYWAGLLNMPSVRNPCSSTADLACERSQALVQLYPQKWGRCHPFSEFVEYLLLRLGQILINLAVRKMILNLLMSFSSLILRLSCSYMELKASVIRRDGLASFSSSQPFRCLSFLWLKSTA